jgi:hypothetical protein
VAAKEGAAPILAACRLLIQDGDRVKDPRSIACGYWGRQQDCPVYEGPGQARGKPPMRGNGPTLSDEPLAPEGAWPVRAPGVADRLRGFLILLGGLSIALLGLAAFLSVTALRAASIPSGYLIVLVIVGTVSLLTHLLTLCRLWVRR